MTRDTSHSLISDSPTERDPKSQSDASSDVRKNNVRVESDGSGNGAAPSPIEDSDPLQKNLRQRSAEPPPSESPPRPFQSAAAFHQEPEKQTWNTRFIGWLASFVALGYGLSLLIHSLLLVVFSLVILHPALSNRFEINGELTEGIEDEISEIIDTRIDLPSPKQETPTDVTLMPLPLSEQKTELEFNTIRKSIEASIGDLDGSGGGIPRGGKKGKNAVTKGNFTVWTVPDDPLPGQMYWIVIEVKVPRGTRSYSSRDLTGYVVATDGFTKPIGYFQGGQITPRGQYYSRAYYGKFNRKQKRLMVDIPPAKRALVEDTIKVRSELLDEEQTLKIVF